MTAISVREAQKSLSEQIHRLTPGQEVVLTEDDRPVAKLVATATRAPFDRLLAAQSLSEAMPLISSDAVFDAYGVQRVWS